uniref:Uncharacterized protein n=1 Tax=uncultured bacterium Contig54 TaxID=1393586 RepID=W0FNS0_9BACT|nr:hypothetical protein [uncultured bacterium Contig54]
MVVTNKYTQDVGALKIKKVVKLNGAETDTKLVDDTYTFTVTSEKAPTIQHTVTITIEDGTAKSATIDGEEAEINSDGFVEIKDLPVGWYGIEEDTEHLKYGVSLTNQTANRLEVTKDNTNNIPGTVFTNGKEVGSLKVTKSFEGSELGANDLTDKQKQAIEFTVNGPNNYSKTFTYAEIEAAGYWQDDNLPVGEYTVKEKINTELEGGQVIDYTLDTSYSIGGGKTSVTASTSSNPAEMVVTNKYTQDVGALKIKKVVKLNGAETDTKLVDDTYTFTVTSEKAPTIQHTVTITIEDGTAKSATIDGEEAEINSDGFVEIKDLPVGWYGIEEDTEHLKYGVSLTNQTANRLEVTKDNTNNIPGTVFTNEKEVGSLKVTKSFEGSELGANDLTDKQKQAIEFTVNGPNNYSKTFTYAEIEAAGYWQDDNLPVGEYTVKEKINTELEGGQVIDYTLDTSYSVGGGKTSVTASTSSNPAEMVVTNKYTRDVGALKIKKVVKLNGAETDTKLVDDTYTFTVTSEKAPTIQHTVTITIEDGTAKSATIDGEEAEINSDGFVEIKDLPVGWYGIEEDTEHLKYGVSLTNQTANRLEVTKDNTNNIPGTVFTNGKEVGSLKVTKSFEGSELGANDLTDKQKQAIEFTVNGPNNYSKTFTYAEIEAAGYWQDDNLPVGEYTVKEKINTELEGGQVIDYTLDTSYSVGGGKTSVTASTSSNPAEMVVTNKYTQVM